MSESNSTTTNILSHDEREMQKYDRNSNIFAFSGLGLYASGGLLLFFVNPIAGIALAGAGVVSVCVGAHQAFKYRKYKKKVEAAKKKETNAEADSVSNDISKKKEQEKNQNIKISFSTAQNKDNNNQNKNNNNQDAGLNSISEIGGAGNNFSSGVSGQYNGGQRKDTQISQG